MGVSGVWRRFLLVLLMETPSVTSLLCLRCNSLSHGALCGPDALSLVHNKSTVEVCDGTCRVNRILSPQGHEVHLRDCSRTKKTGCVSKNFTSPGGRKKSLPGKLCQCDRDLCNVDFTYGRENRAVVSARFQVPDQLPTPAGSKGIPLLPNDLIFFFVFIHVFLLI